MKTIRALTPSPLLLCALLALHAAPSSAVPVYQQTPVPKPPSAAEAQQRQHCMDTVRAQLQTADGQHMDIGRVRQPDNAPDWMQADDSSWSQHLQWMLHGAGKPQLDGLFNACHLADSETAKGAHLNDGVDPIALQQKIDEWLELNRVRKDDEQPPLDEWQRVHLALQESSAAAPAGAPMGRTSPVPEASTWAMLLGGLGLLVLRARRRAR